MNKIEIEDLWKISSNKIKLLTVASFVICILMAPHLKISNKNSHENAQVVTRNANIEKVKPLKEVQSDKENIIVKKAIYANNDGFCFSRIEGQAKATISCPVNGSYGALNKVTHYEVDDNYQVKTFNAFYEPVTSAKYGIMLFIWSIFFATPIYFYAKKKADLSLLKEKNGKRKLFNFKNS